MLHYFTISFAFSLLSRVQYGATSFFSEIERVILESFFLGQLDRDPEKKLLIHSVECVFQEEWLQGSVLQRKLLLFG